MNYETASYYLFSSLLQADAAIIGFGMIFIIYRLQSIESRYALAVQFLRSSLIDNNKLVNLVQQIIEHDDVNSKGSALKQHLNLYNYKELELLVTIPLRTNQIKIESINTLKFVLLHIFFSTLFLFLIPIINSLFSIAGLVLISISIIVYFAFVLRNIFSSAKGIISNPNEFDLKVLSPEIYSLAHS